MNRYMLALLIFPQVLAGELRAAQCGIVGICDAYDAYKESMISSADNTQPIEEPFAQVLSQYFPKLQIGKVRLHTQAAVPEGFTAITLDNDIFFAEPFSYENKEHVKTLLHELEHSTQWETLGIEAFLVKYGLNAAFSALKNYNFDGHSENRMEDEARSKAEIAFSQFWEDISEPCDGGYFVGAMFNSWKRFSTYCDGYQSGYSLYGKGCQLSQASRLSTYACDATGRRIRSLL